jgi:hypothetical protein
LITTGDAVRTETGVSRSAVRPVHLRPKTAVLVDAEGVEMNSEPLAALVEVEGLDDADVQELDELRRSLQDELLTLGVDDAHPVSAGRPPEGSKAGETLQLGALAVAVAPVGLQAMIQAVRDWRSRRAVRKVTITIADASLTLESATTAQQEQLVQEFLERHAKRGS